jgi:hypothetical protein
MVLDTGAPLNEARPAQVKGTGMLGPVSLKGRTIAPVDLEPVDVSQGFSRSRHGAYRGRRQGLSRSPQARFITSHGRHPTWV